jgi:selenocysteine lyase/cysteine desulfurase
MYMSETLIQRTEPIFLDTRSTEMLGPNEYIIRPGGRRFEAFEYNFAGKVGLGAAVEYAQSFGIKNIHSHIRDLSGLLVESLKSIPKVEILEVLNTRASGIVTFVVAGTESSTICSELRKSRTHICAMELNDAPISFQWNGHPDFLRASPHYYNTDDEITSFCERLARLA